MKLQTNSRMVWMRNLGMAYGQAQEGARENKKWHFKIAYVFRWERLFER